MAWPAVGFVSTLSYLAGVALLAALAAGPALSGRTQP